MTHLFELVSNNNDRAVTMRYVLRILGYADGSPCPYTNQYVEHFEFDGYDGRGRGYFTADPEKARKFESKSEALEFRRTQSKTHPLRPDGEPNRPLKRFMALIKPLCDTAK
jgi:hypothetical protein